MSSFDNIADIYDATRGLPKKEMKSILGAMKSELKGCKTILDAGIGTGRFAVPLSKLGFSVFGVDISRKMMKFAQDKDQRELAVADIRKLCFRDYSFDASLVVHMLHLLKDWQPRSMKLLVSQDIMLFQWWEEPKQTKAPENATSNFEENWVILLTVSRKEKKG